MFLKVAPGPVRGSATVRLLIQGAATLALLWAAISATAAEPEDAGTLLARADEIKIADHARFVAILGSLEVRSAQLSARQKEYLGYLRGWRAASEGDDAAATSELKQVIERGDDPTLQFRARSTLMNLQEVTGHYESAYSELNRLLQQLPRVSDKAAREQALMNAAQLYRAVGQTDLALSFTQKVIDEDGSSRGICRGGQQRLAALFESRRLRTVGTEFQAGIDACDKVNEFQYANEIRTHAAKLYIDEGRFDDAITLLKTHYDEMRRAQYPRLLALFDALLAEAYRRKGSPGLAQSFATDSLTHAVKSPYLESSVLANRVLYELAKERGDFKSALSFHEQFAESERGHLDDVSARQLAYDKVVQETMASKLQIIDLTRQNQVLKLEKALAGKALENSRLSGVLLAMVLLFIGLWAYRTKRSQLHFMNMSRVDGLTGISNRHYFISQAETALQSASKDGKELCVVLCDLDHFKLINDRHGHATGDFVLRETVSRCQVHLCANEIFGRFGGEEFSIVLPGCDSEAARQRAEQLRTAIAGIVAASEGVASNVSASFGIASTEASGYELRQVLAHADAALYQAKRTGRNRVVLYDGKMEIPRPTPISLEFDNKQLNQMVANQSVVRG